MSLQEKVLNLKLEAMLALRHASGWQKLIDTHGEQKATEFYKHLGLNHLKEKPSCKCPAGIPNDLYVRNIHLAPCYYAKSFDFEGLTLSREPKEHEKLAVKGIAQAQESSKEQITKVLLSLRQELILDGLERIKKLEPADYHTLILQVPAGIRAILRDRLITSHRQGRLLVAAELGQKQSIEDDDDEFDELDTLTDVTTSRVVNDVQSRITGSASRAIIAGLAGASLLAAVSSEINAGSVSYIDRSATGLANKVISIGRFDEMRRRDDDIDRYSYSAILDQNTCPVCLSDDGLEAASPDDLPPTPNPECHGSDFCRCFIIAITV